MKIRRILVSLGLSLVLILTSVPAFAGPHMMGPANMVSDKQYLYVLAGPKIMLYNLGDLKLLKTVDLPKPTPPKEKADMPFPPPFPPGGISRMLLAADGGLYVLAGPMLYRFSTPDLTLSTTVEMPKPELPKAGN